jgi:hypothetical protein
MNIPNANNSRRTNIVQDDNTRSFTLKWYTLYVGDVSSSSYVAFLMMMLKLPMAMRGIFFSPTKVVIFLQVLSEAVLLNAETFLQY